MHIEIWSIGKANDAALKAAIENYTKRINVFIKIEWKFFKNFVSDQTHIVLKKETEVLLEKVGADDFIFLLDRQSGKNFSSESFSKILSEKLQQSAFKKIVFIIGGAFGIDLKMVQRANIVWSLSTITLPHQLVRLLIVEQIYRALMISKNIPYHH